MLDDPSMYPGRCRRDSGVDEAQSELFLIYKELRFLTDNVREKDKNDAIATDWQFAARIIDRLCLYIFSFITIVSSIVLGISSPSIFS